MLLSKSAHNLYSDFFHEFNLCKRVDFPRVQIYARRGSWLLTTILSVDGITIGRHIFINPKFVVRDKHNKLRVSKELLAHELTHVLQYEKLGFWRFLKIYVLDFWKILSKKEKWNLTTWHESYMEIPHEREARELTNEFKLWLHYGKPAC